MRVHVALTPAESCALSLHGWAALVVDVLRATTTAVAACGAGCARIVPVPDPESAVARAAALAPAPVLLAGERGGEAIPGFALGNSPLECTPERVGGRIILLTTSNGTAAMRLAERADAGALAALTNARAAAAWALAQGRDVAVLCAGEDGAFSLEDAVCAGLLVARLAAVPGAELSPGATAALGLGGYYGPRLGGLRDASRWARRLARLGRSEDLDACLVSDTSDVVPVLGRDGIAATTAPAVTGGVGSPPREARP